MHCTLLLQFEDRYLPSQPTYLTLSTYTLLLFFIFYFFLCFLFFVWRHLLLAIRYIPSFSCSTFTIFRMYLGVRQDSQQDQTQAAQDYGSFKLYHYDPTIAGAVVILLLFIVTTVLHIWQLFRGRCYFILPLAIGGICKTYLDPLTHTHKYRDDLGPHLQEQ